MLLVKTEVKPSSIAGNGLFAAEDIPAGTPIWRLDLEEGKDQILSQQEFETLKTEEQNKIIYSMYASAFLGFIVLGDDARYFNHASNPNTLSAPCAWGSPEAMTIAARDISAGEELTCDYYEFDTTAEKKLGSNLR